MATTTWADLADVTWLDLVDIPWADLVDPGDGRPTISGAAERVISFIGQDILAPDENHDWTFTKLLDVLSTNRELFEQIFRARAGRPGFAAFLDPDTCPAAQLPALAMWAGAVVTPEMTDSQQRTAIKDRPAQQRGAPGRIAAAVKATLIGGQQVQVVERDGGPHRITVRTYPSQTPDPATTVAMMLAATAWWIVPTHADLVGQLISAVKAAHPTLADVNAAYPTLQALLEDV